MRCTLKKRTSSGRRIYEDSLLRKLSWPPQECFKVYNELAGSTINRKSRHQEGG
jgi:hypothetical protein